MSMIGNLLRVTPAELEAYRKDSTQLENRIYADAENPNLVDIDKAWDGIMFLLTGQNLENLDHPLAGVLFSGQLVDEDQDLGYGPAHYVTPEQVQELHAAISVITTDELRRKFDAKKMAELEIYPNVWEHEDTPDYLIEYFETIQEVYATAAQNGEAVITFIN